MTDIIKTRITESIGVKERILNDEVLLDNINNAAMMISDCLKKGGKILFCGNGGSASDALHLTGELVGRFQKDRRGQAAICLNADMASLTSVANDYGFDMVYARAVEGLMKADDIFVGISTSGNSGNVYEAALKARENGGKVVSFLGKNGGRIKDVSDVAIIVPGSVTARIQEAHIMIGYIICEIVEDRL